MSTSYSTMSEARVKRLLLILIPLTVLAAFWPTLHADFVAWDDDANFLNNPHFRGLNWPNLRWMFTTLRMGNYQPLSWLTSCLDYSIWGMDPFGYHATSLALHTLNAVLFFVLAERLLRLATRASEERADLPIAAAVSALLFALHPLRVESVAWLSGQHDLQAAAFYLLAILCHLQGCSDDVRPRRWQMGCAALFLAAMLSKANAITLPVALLLLDVYPLRRLPGDLRQWGKPPHRRVLLEKLPLLAVALAAGLVSWVARHQSAELPGLSLGFRIQQAFYGLAFYLHKTAVPHQLTPFYPVPLDLRLPPATVGISVGLVLSLSIALLYWRRCWPSGLVAWAYYVTTLLPVLGLVSISILLVADRYTYLPCMAWAVLGGAAVLTVLRKLIARQRHWVTAGLASAMLLLGSLSFRQSSLWHDSETLFRYVLALNPDIPEAHNALGFFLVNHHRTDEGMAEYEKALVIKPDFVKAMNNLGLALLSQRRHQEALHQYEKALALKPDYAFGHNNLGLALMHLGRTQEALPHFQKAVELAPDYVTAYANLGGALLMMERVDEAIAQYRKALELRPDYSAAATMLDAAVRLSREKQEQEGDAQPSPLSPRESARP